MENELTPAQKLEQDGRRSEGYELRKARLNAGLTQEEIAKRIGRDHTLISKLEHGTRGFTSEVKMEINKMFGLDFKCWTGLSGTALKKARIGKGHTQEEIAIAMKVHQTTVSGWEREENRISTDNAQQLIALLNIPQN